MSTHPAVDPRRWRWIGRVERAEASVAGRGVVCGRKGAEGPLSGDREKKCRWEAEVLCTQRPPVSPPFLPSQGHELGSGGGGVVRRLLERAEDRPWEGVEMSRSQGMGFSNKGLRLPPAQNWEGSGLEAGPRVPHDVQAPREIRR